MDDGIVQAVMAAVGPVGVGILAAVWLLTRKKENGSQNIRRSQVLETLTKIDSDVGHLRDVTGEIKGIRQDQDNGFNRAQASC